MPRFAALTPAGCKKVLKRNHVGRLAYMNGRMVDIEPLGYAMAGDWLFARSAPGAKLAALAHRPYAAFEVDEVDGPFDWRSVVAHGTVYRLPSDGLPQDRRAYRRAVGAIQRVMPTAFRSGDPVPDREVVYGLRIHHLDGREARSAPARRRKT
jgi:nitroimidazol reductase NimA-like FMN-containing flavoprotein (pyridoxamine 5'-phosphate oxidase superfamily)